jgi:hypothetical protein
VNALGLVLALAGRVLFSFTDPAITESSGLVDLGSLMVTTNDSGDDAVLYTIDPRTGRTVGRTMYAPAVTDVEALAPAGAGQVWAADIGDNTETRQAVEVYRVPVGRGERRVSAPSYRLVYPDGPHDAESLIAPGGRLYVITKNIAGGTVYAAPRHLDPNHSNRLTAVGAVTEWATDAAMLGSGHVLVRGYGVAEVLTFPGLRNVASFVLPAQDQGEGISVGPNGRIRLSSEGEHSEVLQIGLPAHVRAAMHPRAGPNPGPRPNPTSAATGSDGSSTTLGVLALGAGCAIGLAVAVLWSRRRR